MKYGNWNIFCYLFSLMENAGNNIKTNNKMKYANYIKHKDLISFIPLFHYKFPIKYMTNKNISLIEKCMKGIN